MGRLFADERELLSAEEVAGYLGVNQITVYRWCKDGRLPCSKIGKGWRIRRGALEDLIRSGERSKTLSAQLQRFITVPDNLIGICQSVELLRKLDAAFFKVGESRGGTLVKFCGGEEASVEELRRDFESDGLDVGRLKEEGRFQFIDERYPLEERANRLARIFDDNEGRTVWASFDWTDKVRLEEALRQQEELKELVSARQVVIKTAVLEEAAESWPPATHRQAQEQHSGMLWLSNSGVALSRMVPLELEA